ncbi:hypothetical protein ACV34H_33940, partial [Pseudomonas aeruginosa]
MKKFLLPALLFAAASLTGCASYNVSQPIAPVAGAVKTDLKADVAVGELAVATELEEAEQDIDRGVSADRLAD